MRYRRERMEDEMDYLCRDLSIYAAFPESIGRRVCSFTWDIDHVRNGNVTPGDNIWGGWVNCKVETQY